MPAAPRTNRRRHLLVAISSHGYGHAMPTAAVLNSLKALATDVDLTLMTAVPRSILSQRIEGEFDLIERSVEFGMRMASPFDVLVRESTEGYVEIIESWDKLVDLGQNLSIWRKCWQGDNFFWGVEGDLGFFVRVKRTTDIVGRKDSKDYYFFYVAKRRDTYYSRTLIAYY